MDDLLNHIYIGNTVRIWVFAFVAFGSAIACIQILKHVIRNRLKRWAQNTESIVDDLVVSVLERSIVPVLYAGSLYVFINMLIIPPAAEKVIYKTLLFVCTYFVLQALTSVSRLLIHSFVRAHEKSETKEKESKGIILVVNAVIWIMGIVFTIDNLGYNVTTLITGLGIGGIAIALAAQAILGDLFSYFVIFFDRPFEIGDFIIVGDKMGTVEYIGVKTTRIRTLSGEQLICSNTFLTNSQVHNYKRMDQRRVVFKFGVVYETAYGQLKKIPGIIKRIIESKELVLFDRAHFSGFGNSSLEHESVYYVLSADYNIYMDKQQEIYLDILAAFEQEEIEFAYPSQTIYLNQQATA